MTAEFGSLEKLVSRPQWQEIHGFRMPRYSERNIQQAMVQKVAHIISGLHAICVLLEHGMVHEEAALQRSLDDALHEVPFLYFGLTRELTPNHEKLLAAFWEELFDHADPLSATPKKPSTVDSGKIRAFNFRSIGIADTSTMDAAGHALHKAYSGYLHAASPQIMDMFDMGKGRFLVDGLLGTPRMEQHIADAANYFFRGLGSVAFLAAALGNLDAASRIHAFAGKFAKEAGVEEMVP